VGAPTRGKSGERGERVAPENGPGCVAARMQWQSVVCSTLVTTCVAATSIRTRETHYVRDERERELAQHQPTNQPTPFSPIHPFNKITFASLTRRRRQRTPPRCRNLSAYVQFPSWKKFHSAYRILLFFLHEHFMDKANK
jgi:hypothetical protein